MGPLCGCTRQVCARMNCIVQAATVLVVRRWQASPRGVYTNAFLSLRAISTRRAKSGTCDVHANEVHIIGPARPRSRYARVSGTYTWSVYLLLDQ